MFNGFYITEFRCVYMKERQDLQFSDFAEKDPIVVLQPFQTFKEDLRHTPIRQRKQKKVEDLRRVWGTEDRRRK